MTLRDAMLRAVSHLKIGTKYSLSVNQKRILTKREAIIKIPWQTPKTMKIIRPLFRKPR